VEFTAWNASMPSSFFKKKETLETVEYTITSLYKTQEIIFLGLERIKRDTDPKLNSFIRNKLAEIKQSQSGSIYNEFDLYQALFSSLWVNNNIAGLAFFLGKDCFQCFFLFKKTTGHASIPSSKLHQNGITFFKKVV
jgi:hypothetical protein